MRTAKVLIFIHSLGGGGAERVTVALSGYLAASGCDVALVTLAASGPDFYATKAGVRRLALSPRQHRGLAKFLGSIRRIAALPDNKINYIKDGSAKPGINVIIHNSLLNRLRARFSWL